MIARIWHGRVRIEDATEYVRYVSDTGLRQQRQTPGNLASMLFRRDEGDHSEVIVLSLWRCEDDIRAFAGAEIERAVYFPEDERYLLELTERLQHFEVEQLQASDDLLRP